MAINELKIQLNPAARRGLKALKHSRKAPLPDERRISHTQRISGAHRCEIAKQILGGFIVHVQPVDIQNGIAKPRAHQHIADIVHVEIAIYMSVVIHPRVAKLEQAVRPERCKYEQSIFAKHSGYFGCNVCGVTYPR